MTDPGPQGRFITIVANHQRKAAVRDIIREYYPKCTYLILADEHAPTTGTPHVQGYAEFLSNVRLRVLAKRLKGAHLELRVASAKQASDYCRKEDPEPIEEGELSQDKAPGQGKRSDLGAIARMVREGAKLEAIAESYPAQFMLFQRHIRDLRNFLAKPDHLQHPPEVVLYRGPPDWGKSTAIEKEIGDQPFYCPAQDPGDKKLWFDGYDGENIVWLRDFEGCPVSLFKNLCDKWVVRLPVKGGTVLARPAKIYICSNIDPQFWFQGIQRDHVIAVERRITRWMIAGPDRFTFVSK